jgi:esterase/lipase superfamily enzyme
MIKSDIILLKVSVMRSLSIKFIYVISIILCLYINLFAQKKDIDSSVFYKWPELTRPMISPNGSYVMYYIQNVPVGLNTLVLKSMISGWVKNIVCSKIDYGAKLDNKKALFFIDEDSLCIVSFEKSIDYYTGVKSYKVSNEQSIEWLAVLYNENLNLINGQSRFLYNNVISYHFASKGTSMILQTYDSIQGKRLEKITVLDLKNMSSREICKAYKAQGITLNSSESKFAFITNSSTKDAASNEVILYDLTNRRTDTIINNTYTDLWISNIRAFSKNDSSIFINLSKITAPVSIQNKAKLKIWRYNDEKILSERLKELGPKSYLGCIQIKTKRLLRLQEEGDKLANDYAPEKWGTNILMFRTMGDCHNFEISWNPACSKNWFLLNTNSGVTRKLIFLDGKNPFNEYTLSPDNKFIVYYDRDSTSYFSYNIVDSSLVNISQSIFTTSNTENRSDSNNYLQPLQRGIAGWSKKHNAVLIYDANDIWVMDLLSRNTPYNLTNKYGYRHDIVFALPFEKDYIINTANEDIIIAGINLKNKDNGFFKTKLNSRNDPELLTMGPYIYYLPLGWVGGRSSMKPIKAKDTNAFIVRRENSGNFPNYFTTKNFKSFTSISDTYPEKNYNWPTSELHTWKMPDGKTLRGVLYKPENFDSSKKYPIIFNIYEQISNSLNAYYPPEPLCKGCNINPIVFTSNGYLVFYPDIYYKLNEPGESALRAVASAAEYLRNYSWIDSTKMGIQGCSMGGFETNYIITHSKLFKAVCSASAMSDFVSYSSNLSEMVYTNFSLGQFRIKKMIWEDPSVIINNSPITKANNVVTPLLLLHTTGDVDARISQALQLYLILRRLGKKVWLLEYGDAYHGLFEPEQSKDFSLRMLQFFNFYLKDAPAPKWMNENVDAMHNIYNK